MTKGDKLVLPFRENTCDVGPECTGWFKALVIVGDDPNYWLVTNSSFTKSNMGEICEKIAKSLTSKEKRQS